ncbi:hypothetical protein OJ607_10390, partial [Streptococcus anginosus]|nr:hypothetical protein [Streptococcus anginosus]
NSFDENSFDENSFDENSFDENSFDENSFDEKLCHEFMFRLIASHLLLACQKRILSVDSFSYHLQT